jgi:LmbE family N-acetylglucosaminyl deacetylase
MDQPEQPTVVALPDDAFTRLLCVVAHPDDVEYGTAAAVAEWTSRGVEVAYLLLTRGEAGIDTLAPAESAVLREREQVTGSHEVGVTDLTFLDHPDGVLEYGVPLRRDIARAIRRFRPDAVLTGSWEIETFVGLNQADHRAAGLATADAVRDAANRWIFHDQVEEGLEPHQARWLLIAGDPRPTHGVAVSEASLARGVASLEAHAEYLRAIPGHPAPAEMIPWIAGMQGAALGVPHAVLFRARDLTARPPLPGLDEDD